MTTPFYLAVSCWLAWGGLGRRDRRCDYDHLLGLLLWRRLWSCCWLSPGMLAVATRLYFVAVSGAMLPTVSDHGKIKHRHG